MIFNRWTIGAVMGVLLVALLNAGCIPDKCGQVRCMNEGVCVQGTCACAFAFEGEFCEQQWYEKYVGNWAAVEKDKTGAVLKEYQVLAAYARVPDTFYVLGFAGTFDTVTCIRKAFREFTILEKTLPDSTKFKDGQGKIDENGAIVTGLYSLDKNGTVTTHGYTWTR